MPPEDDAPALSSAHPGDPDAVVVRPEELLLVDDDDGGLPHHKRPRLTATTNNNDGGGDVDGDDDARRLLLILQHQPFERLLPKSLRSVTFKGNNHLDALRALLDRHGFRTSILSSPRPGLSVYKQGCGSLNDQDADADPEAVDWKEGRDFLLALLGLHPQQEQLERYYSGSRIQQSYRLRLFCQRIRKACATAVNASTELASLLDETEEHCGTAAAQDRTETSSRPRPMDATTVARIQQLAVAADRQLRLAQLEHEYRRIELQNSTLASAYLSVLLEHYNSSWIIKDVFFKRSSHAPQFERFTFYLYDPDLDQGGQPSPRFTWMPCLHRAVQTSASAETLAQSMERQFWHELQRRGYQAPRSLRAAVGPPLQRYLQSGLTGGSGSTSLPLMLNAHFTPTHPLSFYFHGAAGSGKSSMVRHFGPALNAVIASWADPELMVRHVKQNLNKPLATLRLELDLRPNNNDRSVMSIVQSRRLTMGQSKPGLVVVALEEMADHDEAADPNQLETARLIRQRFAGRKGEYKAEQSHFNNNNSNARSGISNDATIVPLFTSNYELREPCRQALQALPMFRHLHCVPVKAVSGTDRTELARRYLLQCVRERLSMVDDKMKTTDVEIQLNTALPTVGEGDTRPLVRHLRMLAFYVSNLLSNANYCTGNGKPAITVAINETGSCCTVEVPGMSALELRVGGAMGDNLFSVPPRVYDDRVAKAVARLQTEFSCDGKNGSQTRIDYDELSLMLDFWLAGTLAPTVIVSTDMHKIERIVAGVGQLEDVHCIPSIRVAEYKMMRSLYDPTGTPNLRDDILASKASSDGGGGKKKAVAVELHCDTTSAQLAIRELIEDTPSMTAFSSEKSALQKDGLLFGVFVEGEITPEVRSRASLVL